MNDVWQDLIKVINLKEIGHGHIVKLDGGEEARCGGPGMCLHCQLELAVCRLYYAIAEHKDQFSDEELDGEWKLWAVLDGIIV